MEKQPQKKKAKWINPLSDRTRVIPFVVPDQQHRIAALGSIVGQKWRLKKSIQAIMKDFDPIDKPQPGDNLYQFEEEGQDYNLFASMYRNHIDINEEIIYIATFFCKISEDTIKAMKKKAKCFFHGAKVKLHHFNDKNINLKDFGQKQSQNKEKYYDASKLITYFKNHLPKKTYSIAIVTNLLIYNGNNNKSQLQQQWVFGLGAIKDRTSIISFQQIVKKGYGGVRNQNQEDENQLNVNFLSKVINHQLCHTFGMKHCIFHRCLMNGTNHYDEAVKKVQHLCVICVRKLQFAIQFDIAQRYEALGDEKSIMLSKKIRDVVG